MSHLGRSLRRTPARDRTAARTAVAVAIALAAHAALVAWLAHVRWVLPRDRTEVALAPLTAEQWAANRAIAGERPAPPAPVPPAPEPPAPPDERRPKGQFVDLYGADKPDDRLDAKARFDSGRNHTVEKETVSRWKGADRLGHVLEKPSTGEQARAAQPPGEGGDAQRHADGAPADRLRAGPGAGDRVDVPPQQPQQRIALARPDVGGNESVRTREPQQGIESGAAGLLLPGSPSAGGGSRQAGSIDRRLLPTADTYAHLAGGPRDYGIRDVEEGDVTSLNTRRFKFATFYSQLYDSVAGLWHPSVERAVSARDPDRRMFGGKDYETRIDVTLDADGRIKEVRLVQSCGLGFLDREAISAFRDAAPFPNPPRGIVDEHGEIRLGTWTFVVEMTRNTYLYRDQPQRW